MDDTNTDLEHYHDPQDKRFAKALRDGAPDAFRKFLAFNDAALRAEGMTIPRKYTELMAPAVALTTQCAYCIEGHTTAAHAEGATEAEVAETVFIAAALRAGGAVGHGLMALKMYQRAANATT